MKKYSLSGISLISLIITIIVIIILAAIVIFSGLSTPNSANFAAFAQQVDNVYMAVLNKHADLKAKHAIRGNYRTDEQIYIEIATATDHGQYASMNTLTVNDSDSEHGIIEGTGIQNIQVGAAKDKEHSIGMTLPKVREYNNGWYVTKEGKVFNSNGFIYDGKTYFTGYLYHKGELPANETSNSNRAIRIYEDGIVPGKNELTTVPAEGTGDVISGGSGAGTGTETNNGVTITSENYRDYIGKIVTNYKTPNSSEIINIEGEDVQVGTTYRLFYVDTNNKYGDGAGTIYLIENGSYLDDGDYAPFYNYDYIEGSKVYSLNPGIEAESLYEGKLDDMAHFAYYLNPSVWDTLKLSGMDTPIGDKVKYVVGAPTITMFLDSYNDYYNLTTVDFGERTEESPRTKIAYATDGLSYFFAPAGDYASYDDIYACATVQHVIKPDSNIGNMYCNIYSFASPSDYDGFGYPVGILQDYEDESNDFHIDYAWIMNACPIVALDPSVTLEFAD